MELSAVGGRRSAVVREVVLAAVLGLGYLALAEFGYVVHFEGDVQAIWLPVGFATGFLYVAGLRPWYGALAADVLIGVQFSEPWADLVRQSIGDVLEVVIAACEREVLRLVARGLNNVQIADSLSTSERTTRTHASNILRSSTSPRAPRLRCSPSGRGWP